MGRGKTLRQGRNLGISVVTSASEGLENRLSSRNGRIN